MLEHLRFALFPLAVAGSVLGMIAGGAWTWFGAVFFITVNLLADEFGEDYFTNSNNPRTDYLTGLLWSMPVLQLALLFATLARIASPDTTLSGILPQTGNGTAEFLGALASYGVLAGISAVSFGHELVHRPTRFERLAGQALMTLCLHPAVTIEHVYGHHIHACTPRDPTHASRGVGFWRFLPRAYIGETISAAAFEKKRLARRGVSPWSLQNRFLQGILMLIVILAGPWLLAGFQGVMVVFLGGLSGLVTLELGAYITHYGIVREPGRPMEPRHSWNAPRPVSTSVLINAPRHSHHHRDAMAPYWRLSVPENVPLYKHGSSVMSVIALVPPLWFRTMQPLLEEWDRRWATPGELEIIKGHDPGIETH